MNDSLITKTESSVLDDSLINYLPTIPSTFSKPEELKDVGDKTTAPSRGHWCLRQGRSIWFEEERPFIELGEGSDLELTEDEQNGILSDRIIASCLSYLDKSPEIFRYVLSKCVLADKDIMDISALERYHFIQYLDLSRNNLTTLQNLGRMPFLRYLNVANNSIEKLLDFKAPLDLNYVDYTNNNLNEIPDLSEFWSISHLNLSCNGISRIEGLENLRYLTHLNISENSIRRIENLNDLRIQCLILNDNLIDSCDTNDITGLSHLCHMDLSNNILDSLKFLQENRSLESLNLSNNELQSMLEVYYLKNSPYLTRLDLSNNPISADPHYFNVCVRELKRLQYLDEIEITAERKITARTKMEVDLTLPTKENSMKLLLLQQINKPFIGAHIVPYDQPPPNVIILVGPPCSRKKKIIMQFVSSVSRLVLGVSHTTRPKQMNEVHGREYYFITREEFVEMVRKAEFITTSEFNGQLYGIANTEPQKCPDAVVVFHTDINAAIALRVAGICPKLVLAIPSDEDTHMKWLQATYIFERVRGSRATHVKNCAICVKDFFQKFNAERLPINCTEVFEMIDVSDDSIPTIPTSGSIDDQTDSYFIGRNIFRRSSSTSMLSNQFEFEDNKDKCKGSLKSYTGILKTKQPAPGTKDIRSAMVSFTESPNLGEKFGSKRVSFNWVPSVDDDVCHHDQLVETPERSISDHDSLTNNSIKSIDHMFSVLSSNKVAEEPQADKETVYMTIPERFEHIQMDQLKSFFQEIIHMRREYLKLHWENPGFFRAVIFTDNEDDCLKQLKSVLKFIVEHHDTFPKLSFENDPTFRKQLASKMEGMHLEDKVFIRNSTDSWKFQDNN